MYSTLKNTFENLIFIVPKPQNKLNPIDDLRLGAKNTSSSFLAGCLQGNCVSLPVFECIFIPSQLHCKTY